MKNLTHSIHEGFLEIIAALPRHEQWFYMAIQDIKLRYRRSMIGPWWVTISTGIMVLMLGFLWSHIFNQAIDTYLPFFGIGFVIWGWIASQIADSAAGFFQFQGVIKQIKLPFPIFTFRCNVRQGIVLLHNSLIVAAVLLFVGKGFSLLSLLALPNLILIQLNITLLSIVVTIFCSRFQDMAQVVNALTQIIFFFTPILWQVDSIKNKSYLAEWNPIYHWIELIRAPLLGSLPTLSDYLWSAFSVIILFVLATYCLGRFRSRIALWL
jgi:ABC-type polysaccharide/polyol phosphate export permease